MTALSKLCLRASSIVRVAREMERVVLASWEISTTTPTLSLPRCETFPAGGEIKFAWPDGWRYLSASELDVGRLASLTPTPPC